MAQTDVLAPEALLSLLDTDLKPKEGEDSNVILGSSQDALAALSHSILHAVGFRLVGLGEEDTQEDSNTALTRDSEGNIIGLPKGWNAQGPNSYAFRYKHPQSSLTFLIKCMRMSNKFLIHGMGIEDNKTTTLEVVTDDYTSPSFFPLTAEKYNKETIVHGYISTSRIKDLLGVYKINILQKLIPGLNKPGYEETNTTTTTTTRSSSSSRQDPINNDPLRIPPNQPPRFRPPVFDDPYGGDEPSGIYGVGNSDLDPLGANPFGIPRLGGGEPFGRPNRGGGGMFVGPSHPMFDQRGGGYGSHGGDIYGGPQPLPRGSVPPGARFDPIGPFGPRGPNQPRGNAGPDNDEAPPPGYNDMFM